MKYVLSCGMMLVNLTTRRYKYGTGKHKIEHIFGGGYTALETWKKAWSEETHETEYAQKRIKSAKSAKMTPIKIDTTDLYGYFQGSHGRYETFLDSCPCGDFIRNKLPCKHIYRLAMELGIMGGNVETDINAIPNPMPKKERLPLDKQIDVIESLSVNTQQILKRIASDYKSAQPTVQVELNRGITELIEAEVLIQTGEEEHIICFGNKKEICELLKSEQIEYKQSDKVDVLRKICTEKILEKTIEKFGERIYVNVELSPRYSPQKIHFYLHRKFDSESYYDVIRGNFTTYEVSLLEKDLPDDDVTDQLIKRGYYKRK